MAVTEDMRFPKNILKDVTFRAVSKTLPKYWNHTEVPVDRSQLICYLFPSKTDLLWIDLMLWAKATYFKSFSSMQLRSLMLIFHTGLTYAEITVTLRHTMSSQNKLFPPMKQWLITRLTHSTAKTKREKFYDNSYLVATDKFSAFLSTLSRRTGCLVQSL